MNNKKQGETRACVSLARKRLRSRLLDERDELILRKAELPNYVTPVNAEHYMGIFDRFCRDEEEGSVRKLRREVQELREMLVEFEENRE